MQRKWITLNECSGSVLLALAVTCGVGCDDRTLPPDDRLACPSAGIHVMQEEFIEPTPPPEPGPCVNGACGGGGYFQQCPGGAFCESTQRDLSDHYMDYACDTPQICPDENVVVVRTKMTEGVGPMELTFLITNCSTGNQELLIKRVLIRGDERCAFTEISESNIERARVPAGEITVIRTSYSPVELGEDHAELLVLSNAQNYPELHLRMCIQVVGPDSTEKLGELTFRDDFRCEERTETAPCHQ